MTQGENRLPPITCTKHTPKQKADSPICTESNHSFTWYHSAEEAKKHHPLVAEKRKRDI